MKVAGKIALFAIVLCVLTTNVCVGSFWAQQHHMPGVFGKKLEFRLAAYKLDRYDQFSPTGSDVFSTSQAQQIAQSGEAPLGFKWLPMSRFLLDQYGGAEPKGITRVIDGREYLLVSDQAEMMLTHSATLPPWGAESVKITAPYEYYPVRRSVEIELDQTSSGLLQRLTQSHIHHSLAVVVDGQVVMNVGLLSPWKKNPLQLGFFEGQEAEAERLRDSLTK